jgi:hypothetical protein
MSEDESLFRAHGETFAFTAVDEDVHVRCICCSLAFGDCTGARCGGEHLRRKDGRHGYFRRQQQPKRVTDSKQVQALLEQGVKLCEQGSGCDGCEQLELHTCPMRILLQTFHGQQAWTRHRHCDLEGSEEFTGRVM